MNGGSKRRNPLVRSNRWSRWLAGVAVVLCAAALHGYCGDPFDPLLDIMIKNGLITKEEAARVKAEAEANRTNATALPPMPSSKWKINEGIKRLELYGNVRMRYEDRSATDPGGAKIELQRERYAVRLGLRGDAFDNFYFGLRLETGSNGRSPWVTAGTSASATPAYQGPFGKSNAGINLGQAYLGGRVGDWLDVTVGKMPNPLYTTPMVWDTDLSPEGVVERFEHTVGQADFFATLGQFLYEDTNPSEAPKGYFGADQLNFYPSPSTNTSSSQAVLLAFQGGVNYQFATNLSLKVAPVIYLYHGYGVDNTRSLSLVSPGFPDTFVGQGAATGPQGVPSAGWSGYPNTAVNGYYAGFNANQTGIRNLKVLEIPAEFNFKVAGLNARLFGDYAYNLDGAARAQAAYTASQTAANVNGGEDGGVRKISSAQTYDVHAYQAGVAVGNKDSLGLVYGTKSAKNAWEVRTYWQHIEQYALDPNLLDSDFFEGRGNLEGLYTAVAYGLSANMIVTVRYGFANRINSQLGTGGSNQDIPQMNPIEHFHIFQLDLTFRF